MHAHLEIVMPPTDDVEGSVNEIMAPFDENGEDEDGNPNDHAFWDWFVIGGRWSGAKLEAKLGKDRVDAFRKALSDRKVTVSGLRCGKQSLQPASQIELVDALWAEMFPDSGLSVCPLFNHSPKTVAGDVCNLSEVPDELKAERVIVAGPSFDDGGALRVEYMTSDSIWNGVIHVDTAWDGCLKSAISEATKRVANYRDEYRERVTPKGDWLVITVDYHS